MSNFPFSWLGADSWELAFLVPAVAD